MRALRIVLVPLLIVAFALAIAACNGDDDDDVAPTPTPDDDNGVLPPTEAGDVLVLAQWGGVELENFEALVAPWEDETGGNMRFVGTRDITAQLTLNVEGGTPPDVAIPSEIGLMREFARNGDIVPLSACPGLEEMVRDQYPEAWIELGTVDGELYGFFMKAASKGTIWYNVQLFEENNWEPLGAENTWDDLVALTNQIREDGFTPWSVGVESAEASGWPGTDWIQQILINEFDPAVTDGLIDGSVPATTPELREAFEMWGEIVLNPANTVQGGPPGINATGYVESTHPPFESPPQAAMVYLGGFAAGFITDQFPDAQPGEDFDFFTWPGGGITGGADVVYAFNSDETTCSFMEHLASAEAQQVWVERGGFISVNEGVGLDAYPDEVSRAEAEQLLEAEVFRFDLDDTVGGAWQLAFFSAVTEYLANPDQLDALLQNVEAARGEEVEAE